MEVNSLYGDYYNALTTPLYTEPTTPQAPPLWEASNGTLGTPVTSTVWVCDTDYDPSLPYSYAPQFMNPAVRAAFGSPPASVSANPYIQACYSNPISTDRWMTQLWPLINFMPAREFLFLGCHDALASDKPDGYGTTLSLPTAKSFTQDRKLDAMLREGCRFFDLRFAWNMPQNEFYATHSTILFDVSLNDVMLTIDQFFGPNNSNEIIILNITFDTNFLPSVIKDFVKNNFFNTLPTTIGNCSHIRPINPQTYSAANTLLELSVGGNTIVMLNDNDSFLSIAPTIFWSGNSKVDAVTGWSTVVTPIQWFNSLIESGQYLTANLGNQTQFCYLAMQQNNGTPTDLRRTMNSLLADWILNATPDCDKAKRPPMSSTGFSKKVMLELLDFHLPADRVTIPYKPYIDTRYDRMYFSRNYNIISVDYYNLGAFVINSIAQNLKVASKIAGGAKPEEVPGTTFAADPNKYYSITNCGSYQQWAVQNDSTSEGTCIIQYTANSGDNQRFKITKNADGSFTFTSKSANLSLSVRPDYDTDSNLIIGGNSSYTSWNIVAVGGDRWKIINTTSKMLLTIYKDSDSRDASVVQYPTEGTPEPYHHWKIKS